MQFLLLVVLGTCILHQVISSPAPTDPVTSQPHGHAKPTSTENYPNFAQLDPDGDYLLYWKHNETHITFETHVRTKGYVGFGISHNGGMHPSDAIVGWIKDGVIHFKDRHTIGYYEPIIDASQDWTLLVGSENDFGTMLKFVRALDTCDSKEDIPIVAGTTRVIYSYHPDDPEHETGITYHGAHRRGAKSLLLLDSAPAARPMPSDVSSFDFINKNFHVPPVRTFYHCTGYKMPDFAKKQHMIMFEPILQKGHEKIVHHILVYSCPGPIDPKFDGAEYECYNSKTRIYQLAACRSVFIAWAVGGGPTYLPDHVGIPLGTDGDPKFLVLETHYNNPTLQGGYVDSSGMRMHYTPTLRLHDGGILETGADVNNLQIIPPEFENFVSRGYCSAACTNRSLSKRPEGVKVFSTFLHAHLLGMGIRVRLVRNGVELPPIASDEHYDFDYQDYHNLPKEVTIKANDVLITECNYKSKGKNGFTYGGLGTDEEMCLSFLMYYPKVNFGECLSHPQYNQYTSGSRAGLFSYLRSLDWRNSTVRDNFQKATDDSYYSLRCIERDGGFHRDVNLAPLPVKAYQEPVNKFCLQN